MRCFWINLVLFYCASAAVVVDNRLLQTFQNARDQETLSNECSEALGLYVENLGAETDQWALRMLDATSKIPVGLISLNFGELGQFSQCLSTQSENGQVEGKYCLATIPMSAFTADPAPNDLVLLQRQAQYYMETSRLVGTLQSRDQANQDEESLMSVGINWALCLPRNCSDEDVTLIFNNVSESTTVACQTKDDLNEPFTTGAIIAIVILSVFAFLLVASTALDLYFKHRRKPTPLALTAFSAYSNGRKLFKINQNSAELSCLNGMRFYSIIWVLIGHVYQTYTSLPLTNYVDAIGWADSLRSMLIVSGTLSVDTFFLMSGLLVVYGFIKAKHHGIKFNIFQFYIHRYLRLTPALAATVLITATLLRYMGSGPKWGDLITLMESGCQKYWWTTLLYVQNYANPTINICLGHTWYLSIDMQLYILAPIILLPLWKYPKLGIGLVVAAIVTFIIVPFTIAYITEVPALLTNVNPRVPLWDMLSKYYMKTHARAAPWFIGALLGYVLAKIKFEDGMKWLKLNKLVATALWAACLAVGMTCILGGHTNLRGPDYDRLENSFYIGFVKPTWAICLSWIVLACVSGYGGPINWFLSLSIYQVLNRFTYSVYLIHFPLIKVIAYANKIGLYFDELSLAYSFWGITIFSYGLAVIWVLAFESPIVVLEKLIFSSPKKKNKLEENGNKNDLSA